ncbi:MAG: PAS domain S-box protein [Candidatus Marinimicrobia bacterium]|nr:PAS domain S-box protein [Candidatus Neomarinimicrobiota bacterium]
MQKKDSQSPKKTNHRNKFDDRNTALEELPVGILRTDLKGIIKYVNRQFEEITGYQRKDIVDKNVFEIDLFNDDIRNFFKEQMAGRTSDAHTQNFDIRFKHKDGTWHWVTQKNVLIREAGVPVGFQVAVSDITERRRAEEQIRYQAGLLRHVSDAIIASDKNGFIQMWNAAAEKIYGWKADELKGKIFHDVLQPEYRYCSREEVMTKLKTEGVWSGEIVHHCKDGQPISMTSTISVLKDAAGNQTGLVSVNHDITSQKLAEEALKESEEKYRLLVESSRDAIVISQNDKFIFINDAFAQMLGYPKEELLMMNYQNVYTENAVHILEERKKQRSRGAAVPDRYETVFRKKDGSEIPVEANIRIIDYHGQKATFAVIRDITKQKEILKTLEEAAKQSRNLEGFIPICAGCSKIRDDEKEGHPWVNPSEYFASRYPDLKFSHGMCPDCMQIWYPDYSKKKKER